MKKVYSLVLLFLFGFSFPLWAKEVGEEGAVIPEAGGFACQVPQSPPSIHCEKGGAFLCVNTPSGGVVEDFIIIDGTVGTEESPPSQLTLSPPPGKKTKKKKKKEVFCVL